MKSVTSDLSSYLSTKKHFQCCDLYEITLHNGHTYYFTDADIDITYDGKVYKHDNAQFARTQTQVNNAVNVDTMTVSIYADKSDKVDGAQWFSQAHNGLFDLGVLALKRCFFTDGAVVGVLGLFSGWIEVKQCGGLRLDLTVKAKTTGLSQEFPVRKYYPDGSYTNTNGKVSVDSSTDEYTLVTPFVPLQSVLY